MNHWDERAEVLLARARTVNPVPAGARQRVRESLKGSIAVAAAGTALGLPTACAKLPAAVSAGNAAVPAAAAAVAPLGPVTLLAPITVGLALGLSSISPSEVIERGPARVSAPSASPVATSRTTAEPTAKIPPDPHPIESLPQIAASATASSQERSVNPLASKSSREPYSSLSREATALEHARVVLRQGDAELALRLLGHYETEFPNGALGFEAMAIKAVALCRLGRANEGFSILARLEVAAPGSGIVAQSRAACGAATTATRQDEP